MIRLENVKKVFNKRKKNQINVINNTTLEFNNSGLVALLGPSGSGKTTLLNVIGGLDKINSGNIYIDDERITKRRVSQIDRIRNLNIGYIFQDYKLIENMTVYDNVAVALKMIGIKDKSEIERRVLYTLDKVGMLRYKRRPVTMLSGGERQRVGIARALVKDPKIIIADEPTGNLDSKNSIEVMNIIKNISQNRLVILVTHEEELAKFYAERIIELKDGEVIKDYLNKEKRRLNYRIDNKIYLKDFDYHNVVEKDNIKIDIYSEDAEKIKIDLIFKNGNIYLSTNRGDKVSGDENIEIINDHYEEIDEYDDIVFNVKEVSKHDYELKYSSIFKLGNFITNGFKKLLDYPLVKKILLLGFFLAGCFIFYSASSYFAAVDIKEENFVAVNKNYLSAQTNKLSLEEFNKLETLSGVDYILPGNTIVNFRFIFDDYYQVQNYSEYMRGSISDISRIKESDLTKGRMPNNNQEIVVDKLVLKRVLDNGMLKQLGINEEGDFLNRQVTIPLMGKFKIVGFTDMVSPSIYTNKELFINIINNGVEEGYEKDIANQFADINLVKDNIKITKGRIVSNDYEIIVPESSSFDKPLDKTIDTKINNQKLKVVGYYKDDANYNSYYFTTLNTIKAKVVSESNNLSVISNNETQTKETFMNHNIELKSSYEIAKNKYVEAKQDTIEITLLVSGVILLISLIEIYLMIRSSFLSRVKEVGVYRAIGVKKSDIYKMFAGEVIAITTISSVPGILFMTYVLDNLAKIDILSNYILVNTFVVLLSIALVFVFNIIVGLLPVFTTLRKTPAQILSRQDV